MEQKVVINAKIYTGEGIIDNGFLRIEGEKILETGSMNAYQSNPNVEEIDASGKLVIPGMIDVHIHGGYGVDVMDADPEKLVFLSEQLLKEGVTSFFATHDYSRLSSN